VTGRTWGTAINMNERNREHRQNVRGNVSLYKPDLFHGNHEFKIGFDYFQAQANRNRIPRIAPYYQLVFRGGCLNPGVNSAGCIADQIQVNNTPVTPDAPLNYYGAYIHDTWNVGRKLTLNLGVRYAYDNGKVAAVCREAAFEPGHIANPAECFPEQQFPIYKSFSPRARFAFDFTGDGRTLLKGGWGRYHKMRYADELHTANRNVITTTIYRWRDLNGNGDYNPGEVDLSLSGGDFIRRTFSGQTGALADGIVNPDEEQPYTDEYMLQFEREVVPGFGVRLTGVHSRTGNWVRYENSLRPYEVYTIPITNRDPGPDGSVGTADDTGNSVTYFEYPQELASAAFQRPWIVNDNAANKKYNSFELAASKRLANRWQLMSSFSFTKIDDPLPNNVGGATNFGANTRDPNSEIFAADDTREWQFRLSGGYQLPYDVLVSGNYQLRSGSYWARTVQFRGGRTIPNITVPVEPRDSNQRDSLNILDVRFEKRFNFAAGKSLMLRSNVLNILNINTVTNSTVLSGPNFGIATEVYLPRVVDFSVSYAF
jgi:hypothetical protein